MTEKTNKTIKALNTVIKDEISELETILNYENNKQYDLEQVKQKLFMLKSMLCDQVYINEVVDGNIISYEVLKMHTVNKWDIRQLDVIRNGDNIEYHSNINYPIITINRGKINGFKLGKNTLYPSPFPVIN